MKEARIKAEDAKKLAETQFATATELKNSEEEKAKVAIEKAEAAHKVADEAV